MPPKKGKKEEGPTRPPVLGRVSGHLKMGFVGPPNVGKSSTLNLLTNMGVPAENYPFCTIDPSTSRAYLDDVRVDRLCEIAKPDKEIRSHLDITDVAGLIAGASEGAGLGNAFLAHISAVDGIYMLMRAFDDPDVTHVNDVVDPVADLEMITGELLAKDLQFAQSWYDKVEPLVRRGIDKSKKAELDTATKALEVLKEKKQIRHCTWSALEVDHLRPIGFLTGKPHVYVVNLSKADYLRKKNKHLLKIKTWLDANAPGEKMVLYSVSLEEELKDMDDDERERFLKDNSTKSQLNTIVKAGFDALNLINFFTVGKQEVRAWVCYNGWKAPQAAGVIHTDFQKHFIKAEVYHYDDIDAAGTEVAVREAGKLRQEGKEYVVKDGDCMNFKHNAGGAGKKK